MSVTNQAFAEFSRFTELRRRLIEADPDIDDRTLADTLEGATTLKEAIGFVVRSALDDEALAEALKTRLEKMRERAARIETTAAKKRELALAAMEEADIEKILEPDFTVSVRPAPPSVIISSEQDIPQDFWLPQPPKLDRRRLLESLKAGIAIMGAELANTRIILSVRTK
jgi:Siphovirus Gp157